LGFSAQEKLIFVLEYRKYHQGVDITLYEQYLRFFFLEGGSCMKSLKILLKPISSGVQQFESG
jgi:hypothetical protein